jgi:proteasome lid subunit RPN8/RPN11
MFYAAYFFSEAFEGAREHFKEAAERGVEAIGLFAGRVYSFQGKEYLVAEEYVTAENDSSALHTRFAREAFKEIAEKYSGKPFVVWAHSHPGYGSFMSSQDLAAHNSFFDETYHLALVIDPLRGEEKLFKVEGEKYCSVPFALVKKK